MFVTPLVVNWINELPSKLNPIAFSLNLRRSAHVQPLNSKPKTSSVSL